ncbi:GNAT family N-acetyltransferase [Pleurocapsa sp. PCC 7319]|uniref:GNAT family N-acetyltransferase n=1 Tax=Pleurocapsa sp. PCC 7319 TaxID=118161 RepID=UPI0003457432|nr:GNAT family N-acetyltransferase [Pleurocapsa sp. PCC 7319]
MLRKILDLDKPLWRETLQQIRHDVYHLPEYVALEAKRTNTSPQAIVITENDSIFFVPYLLRSCEDIVSSTNVQPVFDVISPYGYPGILLNEAAKHNSDFPDLAFKEFKQVLKSQGVCSAFLRLHPILGENFANIFPQNTFQENGKTVSVNLTLDEEKIWAKTRKGHQSTINKCIRLGLTARIVSFADYIDEFISIYEETMDRVKAKGVYYFSRDYFQGLLKLGDKLHLGIVESEGNIVCASLFFESCGIVQAHLGGTKTEFLKQSPFNLLLHHMRLWAKARGNQYLHIGGGVGGKKDNLYTFKSGFSKQRHEFLTLRSVIDNNNYNNLIEFRAQSINKSVEDLKKSQFFPAYRAS